MYVVKFAVVKKIDKVDIRIPIINDKIVDQNI